VKEDELEGHDRRVFKSTHATIKKVTGDIEESWHFNTAIAAVMELFNEISEMDLLDGYVGTESKAQLRRFNVYRFATESMVLLLAPFVPHICEELWSRMANPPSIFEQEWPEWDEEAARHEEIEIPVQINGTVRERMTAERDEEEDSLREKALALEGIRDRLEGKEVVKVIVVPNRIVNVVAQ
jgi:leucyl-tRNA synthetase